MKVCILSKLDDSKDDSVINMQNKETSVKLLAGTFDISNHPHLNSSYLKTLWLRTLMISIILLLCFVLNSSKKKYKSKKPINNLSILCFK